MFVLAPAFDDPPDFETPADVVFMVFLLSLPTLGIWAIMIFQGGTWFLDEQGMTAVPRVGKTRRIRWDDVQRVSLWATGKDPTVWRLKTASQTMTIGWAVVDGDQVERARQFLTDRLSPDFDLEYVYAESVFSSDRKFVSATLWLLRMVGLVIVGSLLFISCLFWLYYLIGDLRGSHPLTPWTWKIIRNLVLGTIFWVPYFSILRHLKRENEKTNPTWRVRQPARKTLA